MIKVAVYYRENKNPLSSKESVKSYYNDLIKNKAEWQLADFYSDNASINETEESPEFNRMISDCKESKIDLIITKSISRFMDDTLTTIKHIRKLKEMGVGVIFEKENINTLDEQSQIILDILEGAASDGDMFIEGKARVRGSFASDDTMQITADYPDIKASRIKYMGIEKDFKLYKILNQIDSIKLSGDEIVSITLKNKTILKGVEENE